MINMLKYIDSNMCCCKRIKGKECRLFYPFEYLLNPRKKYGIIKYNNNDF